jgi:glycosyltransferase involved in cell wall biosynthesis
MRDADVVYSTAFKPHLALTLARRHPVVWHLHGFPPEGTGNIWRWLARKVPEANIANSEAVGNAWSALSEAKRKRKKGNETERLVVVPNGINLDRFRPAEKTFWIHDRLRIPRDHRVIGMPSVFHKWKGQLEVIKAFEQIVDEFQDVHLVIVGGSIYDTLAEREFAHELDTEVDRAATGEWQAVTQGSGPGIVESENGDEETENGIPTALLPRVHVLPFQSKIEKTYPEFDLAVHYSTRPEPFGRVIVEAMACGVPVIAANEGGPAEILGGGIGGRREAGWLAEPRNPVALADTLRSALQLPDEVVYSIGEAGRRRAEDCYSWRRFAAEVAGVLRGVADRTD